MRRKKLAIPLNTIYMQMNFKTWFNESINVLADKVFSQREKNAKLPHDKILNALGISSTVPLKQINRGSLATIYQHPLDPKKIIKVTSDLNDAQNLVKAQKINSPNIVKIYQNSKINNKAVALIADYIQGNSMPYNTNAMLSLINGDNLDDAATASREIFNPDATRENVLNRLGLNTMEEKKKLSQLFKTLAQLERIGIDVFDFTDNVLDDGKKYVMIDLGM